MARKEADLEKRIEAARKRFLAAVGEDNQRKAFDHMAELIAQRTPRRVQQMERERGLSR